MTANVSFKQSVRRFADVNDTNYTSALREFDRSTGEPLYRSAVDDDMVPLRRWRLEEAWASARGLTLRDRTDGCFHELSSDSGRVAPNHREKMWRARNKECFPWERDLRFKDHSREFLFRGPSDQRRRLAVISFAPYESLDDEHFVDEARMVAERYDLRVRIGFAADATYGFSTIPVVFWNPRVIDLP